MKNSKRIVLIIMIILLLIVFGITGIYIAFFSDKKESSSNIKNISYDASSEDYDFSSYTTYNVKLDEVKNKYSITKQGVYHLTGSLSGYIEVSSNENVVLVLDNVSITNETGPCINVINAKNVYIKLEGESTLTDGSNYTGFDDVDAVVYSKDDLIIYGDGTLNINANYLDGIVSKDDLVINSGTYNIKSNDDAIKGKDSVTIVLGVFNIESNGDAIKTTNEEDTEKGYILIKDGTFNIKSKNDGIDASTNIQIDKGTFNITTNGGSTSATKYSEFDNSDTTTTSSKGIKAGSNIVINDINVTISSTDDGIHANGDISLNGGKYEITSDDDGIHADGMIEVNKGTYKITAHEGIEATYVKINDGSIEINASDDGINAGNKSDKYSVKIEINGGTVTVNMGQGDTDGIDSNGDIVINGGIISVTGNSAFDYDGTAELNGGKLIVNGVETSEITNQFMGVGASPQGGMMGEPAQRR